VNKKIHGIVYLFLTLHIYAQSEKDIKFGFKAGLAFSSSQIEYQANIPTETSGTKTSLLLGIFLNIPVNKSLFFQPAVFFLSKGIKNQYGDNFGYNYFEVPLNILYKSPAKNGMFFMGGGLSPAFKVSEYYNGNALKKFDLGLNVLAGYQSPIGFSINLGYTYGLLNVSTNKEEVKNFKNRYFSVSAGYEF
jgi:hypothetical protein